MTRIKLWKPIPCGTKRRLSHSECRQLVASSTLMPTTGSNWELVRDDIGQLSLLRQDKDGGALWPLEETT